MNISVVIPAFNEEERLNKSLGLIAAYLKKRYAEYEIIVVDDGSSDRTAEVAGRFKQEVPNFEILSNSKNRGKGYSVKKGILASKGDLILFTDADLSTPIEELEKLEGAIKNGYDIAIASRGYKDSVILKRQNILREYMGKAFNVLIHFTLMSGIPDTQCGFKLFRRETAMAIFPRQKIDGFSFDAEILYLAKQSDYKIKSMPARWANSPKSKVKLLSSSIGMFFDLIKIKRLHREL